MAASIETEIKAKLLADVGVAAIAGTRVFEGGRVPEGTEYPALTVMRVTRNDGHELTGAAGFASPLIQVSGWARTHAIKENLMEAARLALQNFDGVLGAILIYSITLAGGGTLRDNRQTAEANKLFGGRLDFRVVHSQSTP